MNESYRVVIADDDPDVQLLVGKMLTRNGFTVSHAWNGVELLEGLAGDLTDVAIVDLRMPGVSGLQALAEMQQTRPDLLSRIVVFTGASEEIRSHIGKFPVFAVLAKVDDEELLVGSVIQCARERVESRAVSVIPAERHC